MKYKQLTLFEEKYKMSENIIVFKLEDIKGSRYSKFMNANPNAETIEDITEPIKIHVQSEDLRKRKTKSQMFCPTSNACRREFGYDGVWTNATTILLVKGTRTFRGINSKKLTQAIITYDKTGKSFAGEFDILVPKGGQRLGQHKPEGNNDGSRPRTILKRRTNRLAAEGVRQSY